MLRPSMLPAILVGLAVLTAASSASAMYHPTLGRWAARDSIGYADGMNLQEYVGGRPVRAVDPSGHYDDEHVVDTLHACWSAEPKLCYEACGAIADANASWDYGGRDAPSNALGCLLGVGLLTGCDKNYDVHMPGAGAPTLLGPPQKPVVSGSKNNSAIRGYIDEALESCDANDIGKALHSLQDSYSHGGQPGFGGSHPVGRDMFDPKTGKPAAKSGDFLSGGVFDDRVDKPEWDRPRHNAMKSDLQSVMNEIADKCWCKLCGPDSPFKD